MHILIYFFSSSQYQTIHFTTHLTPLTLTSYYNCHYHSYHCYSHHSHHFYHHLPFSHHYTQFDPVVEVGVDDSGQHTMVCLGELHLQQCLKTLVERFTK
jgi:hypothetical protein